MSILPRPIHRLASILRLIKKGHYYLCVFMIFMLITPISYFGFSIAVEADLFYIYDKLDEPLKDYLSLETWWIETIIRLCVPVFLSVALSIQLGRLHEKDAQTIKSIVPWIPIVRDFFSVKMPIFFVLTASVMLGAILLLVFGGKTIDWARLLMTTFPAAIFTLSEFMRNALSSNPGTGWLSELTMKYHNGLTKISILLASIAWIFSDLYTPIKSRWDIFEYAKSLV